MPSDRYNNAGGWGRFRKAGQELSEQHFHKHRMGVELKMAARRHKTESVGRTSGDLLAEQIERPKTI